MRIIVPPIQPTCGILGVEIRLVGQHTDLSGMGWQFGQVFSCHPHKDPRSHSWHISIGGPIGPSLDNLTIGFADAQDCLTILVERSCLFAVVSAVHGGPDDQGLATAVAVPSSRFVQRWLVLFIFDFFEGKHKNGFTHMLGENAGSVFGAHSVGVAPGWGDRHGRLVEEGDKLILSRRSRQWNRFISTWQGSQRRSTARRRRKIRNLSTHGCWGRGWCHLLGRSKTHHRGLWLASGLVGGFCRSCGGSLLGHHFSDRRVDQASPKVPRPSIRLGLLLSLGGLLAPPGLAATTTTASK